MRNETEKWLGFADEHLSAAKLLLANNLLNPCMQNAQHAVEKVLKAVFIERRIKYSKTRDILALKYLLKNNKVEIDIPDNDCDFINSIYLPSLYPADDVLSVFVPDKNTCQQAITIAEKVIANVKQYFAQPVLAD